MEMDKLPHIPVMDFSGTKSNLCISRSEGKGIGTNVVDTSAGVQQKAVVHSLKELSKREKQKDSYKGSCDKSKREKHLHPNRILKKATKKLIKSKGESLVVQYTRELSVLFYQSINMLTVFIVKFTGFNPCKCISSCPKFYSKLW
jgi:hypothetical protein